MRYFNKYYDFCDHSPPEIYLEDFKADKHANGYNEEFYLKIYHLRMEEKKNESANPFNTNEVSTRIYVYNQLPDIIQRQIDNLQLFLLGIVSPSVYTMMHMYFDYVNSNAWDLVKEYWKEKERNKESMSSYLKKLYEVEWIDGIVKQFEFDKGNLKFVVEQGIEIYTIHMKNATVTINSGKLRSGTMKQYEIFFHNPEVEINFLTYFSDISIRADDIEYEVFEEEF